MYMDNVTQRGRNHAAVRHDADWTANHEDRQDKRLDVKEEPVNTVAHTLHEVDPMSQQQELHQTTYDDMFT